MIKNLKFVFTLYILSIITPFLAVIFLIRSSFCITVLALELGSLLTLVITTVLLYQKLNSGTLKGWLVTLAFLAVVIFFFGYGELLYAADYMAFKRKEDVYNKLRTYISSNIRPDTLTGEYSSGPVGNSFKEKGIINYEILSDGTIKFTIYSDALNNDMGYAYSETGKRPGLISDWRGVARNWYVWYN